MPIHSPIISVIMPNYNSKYIGEAINSVVNQTFEDWRLFVVDDGSTDCSRSIIILFAREEKGRIRHHFLYGNSGSPVAPRNEGIKAALGSGSKYVAFLDSDDLWESDKLERQIKYMDNAYSCHWSYHDLFLLGGRKQRWSQLSNPHEGWCFKELLFKNFIPNSSVVLRSELLEQQRTLGGIWHNENYRISHDWELLLRISKKYPVGYIPLSLGSLRLHSGSVVTSLRRRRRESRAVVRLWKDTVPRSYYWRCLLYYYAAEIWDIFRMIKARIIMPDEAKPQSS